MNSAVRLAMIGCNHRHSSLSVRERLAFTPEQTRDALASWCATHHDREAVLLSTCNRTELYAASADPQAQIESASLAQYLAGFHNVPIEEVQKQLVSLEG